MDQYENENDEVYDQKLFKQIDKRWFFLYRDPTYFDYQERDHL